MKHHLSDKVPFTRTVCTLALLAALVPQPSAAPLGTAFTYQGELADAGKPANGTYDVTFSLYDAVTLGDQVGGSLTNIGLGLSNGLFTVVLDFGAAFDDKARWLEIGVRTNGGDAFATLTPRQPLTPSPYSLFAPYAGTAASANSVAAANITGTLALGQLPTAVVTNNASAVSLNGSFSGNGSGLTSLNADNLSSGTVADARLSANVALHDANQTFTGINLFDQPIGIGTANPGQLLQVGDANTSGSQGMIRLASHAAGAPEYRIWDIGVPQTGSDVSGAGYCFVIDDTLLGPGPEFLVHWGTGRVGIGRTNPATALDVNGTVTATAFVGDGSGLTNLAAAVFWHTVAGTSQTAAPNQAYLLTNNAQVTLTLPAAPGVGNTVRVSGTGAGGWKVAQNSGQFILAENIPGNIGAGWVERASSLDWVSVASSADGTKLVAAVADGLIYTSSDAGVSWTARAVSTGWQAVASSADGTKLVAAAHGGQLYTSTDSGVTWTARDSNRNWHSIASSADGAKLVAVVYGGDVYTSSNSGTNWTAHSPSENWISVASSANGSNLVAAVHGGWIWTSSNAGASWTAYTSLGNRNWQSVACSEDGAKLVAAVNGGQIYTSSDSGVTWTARASNQPWYCVASSADGTKLAAAVLGGEIYTSSDSGVTWTARASPRNWFSIASSADGTKLVAAVAVGHIYTSGASTTPGPAGYLTGNPYAAVELQYVGNGVFMPLSYVGTMSAY